MYPLHSLRISPGPGNWKDCWGRSGRKINARTGGMGSYLPEWEVGVLRGNSPAPVSAIILHPAPRIPPRDTFPSTTTPASLPPQLPPAIPSHLRLRISSCPGSVILPSTPVSSLRLMVLFLSIPLSGCPKPQYHKDKDFVLFTAAPSKPWTLSGPRLALCKQSEPPPPHLSQLPLPSLFFHLIPKPQGCTTDSNLYFCVTLP